MKLAFLITAHNDPSQLRRLITSLPAGSGFFVHIDAKSDLSAFSGIAQLPNVHFARQRVNVMWGSYSQLKSQIVLLKEAMASEEHYDYFISLSGLDYPLWSNGRLLSFFSARQGTEFIEGIRLDRQGGQSRLYRHRRPLNRFFFRYGSIGSKFRVALREIIYALGFRKPLSFKAHGKTYHVYKGSSWWAITRELAQSVLDHWADNEYRRFFLDFFGPDETFVHTVVFNSPFKDRALPSPEHAEHLEDLTPLTFIDYTTVIKVLDDSDFDRLMASGKLFCRKVVSGVSDSLVQRIERVRGNYSVDAGRKVRGEL